MYAIFDLYSAELYFDILVFKYDITEQFIHLF